MGKKELFDKVNEILWEEWGPIDVNDYGGPPDEYSGSAPSVLKLISGGADVFKITELLHHHANVNMGLSSKLVDHKPVAIKLHSLIH